MIKTLDGRQQREKQGRGERKAATRKQHQEGAAIRGSTRQDVTRGVQEKETRQI